MKTTVTVRDYVRRESYAHPHLSYREVSFTWSDEQPGNFKLQFADVIDQQGTQPKGVETYEFLLDTGLDYLRAALAASENALVTDCAIRTFLRFRTLVREGITAALHVYPSLRLESVP